MPFFSSIGIPPPPIPLKLILDTELRVALLEVEEGVVDALGGGVRVPPPALSEAAELGVHLHKHLYKMVAQNAIRTYMV